MLSRIQGFPYEFSVRLYVVVDVSKELFGGDIAPPTDHRRPYRTLGLSGASLAQGGNGGNGRPPAFDLTPHTTVVRHQGEGV